MSEAKSDCLTLKELFSKEVINCKTGERLGHITDAEIETERGIIINLFVSCPQKKPISVKRVTYKFRYCDITRIGDDVILIENCTSVLKNKVKQEKNCCK